MDEWKKKAIEGKLAREYVDPAHAAAVTTFLEAQTDWYATCRYCGEELTGTLKELKAHRCKHVSEG